MPLEHSDLEPISHRGNFLNRGLTFGALLKQLRKRAGMTQADVAAAVDFSVSHISNLEKNQRLPALAVVVEKFIPALGLQEEPHTAQRLVELAAGARGEQIPADFYQRTQARSLAHAPLTHVDTHLPCPLMPILGRERDLTAIGYRLLGHQGRLFTLIGPPGIGKTTLGLAVAARLQASFEDGVYFVPLASVADPAQIGPVLMNGLGLTESSTRSPQARLVEYLRQKRLLLLLDNFEHLLAAAPFLITLLQECPGLHCLITSRAALRVRAEQRFKVAALAPEVAMQLFVQRAQAVEPDFALTDKTALVVKQLCQRLDYLPLAIELIATQLTLFTPQELLARLQEHSLDLLDNDAPDLEPRHQTLRHAIQSSYALLSVHEQAFFCRLGVFAGRFDLPASEALWDHAQTTGAPAAKLLAALVNKSLVQVETYPQQSQRFKLLETLREFALEQLHRQGVVEATRRRHAAYFCRLAEIANPLLRGPDEILWLERLEADHDNLRAAAAWALASPPDLETGLRLVAMLWWFWYMRGYMREGLDRLHDALRKDGGHFPALRAKILQGACTFTWTNRVPDYKRKARGLIEESITLYRQLDDPWNLAKSLGYLGFSAETLDEFAPAAAEARQLFGRINDAWGLAWVYVMELYVAQAAEPSIPIEEGVRLMRSIGAKFGLALTLQSAAVQAYRRGDYERARLAVEEAIVIYHQTGEKWTLAQALFVLADILITQNQWDELAEICAEGLRLAQQTGASALEAQLRQRQTLLLRQRLAARVVTPAA